MARLWSSGFELDAVLNAQSNLEWTVHSTGQTAVTSPVRGGTYALKIDGTQGIQQLAHQFVAAAGNGPFFFRAYLYISANPNVQNGILEVDDSSNNTCAGIALNSSGQLQLYAGTGYFGSLSSSLSLNVWHRLELRIDKTGGASNYLVEGLVDGNVFSSANNLNFAAQMSTLFVGGAVDGEPLNTGTWYFDDVAINDTTGTYQTGYPGDGTIVRLSPNATGDANSFATTVGGTVGAANNYTRVNEVIPDNATSYNASVTLGASDLFRNTSATGMIVGERVNVVHVGGRMANITAADATTALKFQIEKTSGGTLATSSAIIPNSTTWNTTSALVNPYTYPITLYQDPDGINWAPSTINSMQIGYTISTAGTNAIGVSTVWAMVEYTSFAPTSEFFEFM